METRKIIVKTVLTAFIVCFVSCESDDLSTIENIDSNSLKGYEVTAKITGKPLLYFKGPEIYYGDGYARSWMSVSEGIPQEIGVELTPECVNTLSEKQETIHKVLPLHLKARQITAFDHIGLDWNPQGHDPEGIFDKPHFDIHFYTISLSERLAIPEYSPSSDASFNHYPPEGYMPADYAAIPGSVGAEGKMEKHWLPMPLPDYLPFTKILIWGTFDGKVTFIEPMITLETLQNLATPISTPYSQPELFEKQTYYPTNYNIFINEKGNTCISLGSFVMR